MISIIYIILICFGHLSDVETTRKKYNTAGSILPERLEDVFQDTEILKTLYEGI